MTNQDPNIPSNEAVSLSSSNTWLAIAPLVLVAAGGEQRSSDVLLWLIVPLLLGAVVLALLALRAYRRERVRRSRRTLLGVKRLSPGRQVATTADRRSGDGGAVVTMVALEIGQTESPRLPLPVLPSMSIKICRTCGREFRTALTSCPFDQTKLVNKSATDSTRLRDDYLDTRRVLMRCDECERQYELGTKFCPFDGERLSSVDEDDVHNDFDGRMICAECGESFDEQAYFCPNDGSRLHPADSSDDHLAFVSLPLVICPKCQREFPHTMTTCPDDGQTLLPLAGRKTGGFPRHGLGPRQQVCPKCGDRYGTDVAFCALDGTALLQVN